MLKFSILLFVCASLFANQILIETMSNDPAATIDGKVNVFTGLPNVCNEDLVIQGAEPIRLFRVYIHGAVDGYWSIPGDPAQIIATEKEYRWIVEEPDECPLIYRKEGQPCSIGKERYIRCTPSNLNTGFSNTCRGEISSQTNLRNHCLFLEEKRIKEEGKPKDVTIHRSNGAIRTYKRVHRTENIFVLLSEHLPNSNWILYAYEEPLELREGRLPKLLSIRTTNNDKTKEYAKATFLYKTKYREDGFEIVGSDGQKIEYRFTEKNSKNKPRRLKAVIPSSFPWQELRYTNFDIGDGVKQNRLSLLENALERKALFEYYTQNKETVAGQKLTMDDRTVAIYHGNEPARYELERDFRRGRIKTISAPVGDTAALWPTHSFIYRGGSTSVYDHEGKRADYYNEGGQRLDRIERFSKEGKLESIECYAWAAEENKRGNLLAKSLLDADRAPLFSTFYVYDYRGNVLEEHFCGNLTGLGSALVLDKRHYPLENGVEMAIKRCSYSYGSAGAPDLLIRKELPSGIVYLYSYLSGTNLPVSQLSYDGKLLQMRKFWEYSDGILIREISDDGSSSDPKDLSNVTYRTIQETVPYSKGSYVGLPEVILEKYWEKGEEHLLRKTVLHYGIGAQVTEKEVYDATETYCYTQTFEYDEKNRLCSETDPLGRQARYQYDPLGNCIYKKEFSGRVERRTHYDYSNRPCRATCQGDDGIVLTRYFSYDGLHQLRSETSPQEATTHYAYDSLGRCVETELPPIPNEKGDLVRPLFRKEYNSAGQEIVSTDAMGHRTTKKYNAYGKPVLIKYPDGSLEQYGYFLDGSLKSHTDANGILTTYVNDAFGRIIQKTKKLSQGFFQESYQYKGKLLLRKTDAEGNVTKYSYDGAGRKIGEECCGEKTLFFYDALGRICKTQKGETSFVVRYDFMDRVIEERTETLSQQVLRKIEYEYDTANNKKRIIRFIAGNSHSEIFQYDSQNRLIKKIDPQKNFETTHFDDFYIDRHGQKVLCKTHTDSLGLQTIETCNTYQLPARIEKKAAISKLLHLQENSYDLNGALSLQIDTIFHPEGAARSIKTRRSYDSLGRLTTLVEADSAPCSKTTTHTYTPTGLFQSTTKPDGVVLNYGYNDLGCLTSLTSSDGTVSYQMEYNFLGHLLRSNHALRSVDAFGRLLTEALAHGAHIENSYDSSGRRTKCFIPQADCLIEYEYLASDLKTVRRRTSDRKCLYEHVYSERDLSGNLLQERCIGDRGVVTYTLDPLSRRSALQAPHFSQQVLAFDAVGNVRKMSLQGEEINYDYDALYQLTSESGLFSHRYLFDSWNNRLQKDGEKYQIDELNQLISHVEYDRNGNPRRWGDNLYTYDALDRLIQVETPTFTVKYAYDSLHRRMSQTTFKNGTREKLYFLYDGQNEIGSLDENGRIVDFRILGHAPHAEIGAAIALELNGKTYAPIHDLQGNVALLLPLHETEIPISYRYSAFGEERGKETALSPWRFSSKRIDATGLVYYGRRYYTSELGRWLTPDPSGFTDGMNLYAFLRNDPLTHFDEYGLEHLSQMTQMVERQRNAANYLNNTYKFENHYHHYVPFDYSQNSLISKPRGEVVLFTGIRTTVEEHREALKYTSQLGGGVPMHGIHMPTRGLWHDLGNSLNTLHHGSNSTIFHGERYFREASERVGRDGKILAIGHSGGAMNEYFSAMRLPKEVRDKISFVTIAPAKIIPQTDFPTARNFRSSGLDFLMFYHQTAHRQEYQQAIQSGSLSTLPVDSSRRSSHDHDYMSPTYKRTIRDSIESFAKTYECR
ncbi:MAG: RHS repeat-associated core domain-containing protein [Verrucomicrobiota bacterium]|nr:RHS repeat-associated core domain-containing protein [Verrucomicrobiota bacterium]